LLQHRRADHNLNCRSSLKMRRCAKICP
jgi:hypothetical protein